MFRLLYDTLHKGYKWGIFNTLMEPYKFGLKSVKRPKVKYYQEKYGTLVKDVVDYLNMRAGTTYKHTSISTINFIIDRASEGYTISDFKMVIDRQVYCWINDPLMVQYLRPSTLFNQTKFTEYVHGTPITEQNSQQNIEENYGEGNSENAGFTISNSTGAPAGRKVAKGRKEFKSVENLQNIKRR